MGIQWQNVFSIALQNPIHQQNFQTERKIQNICLNSPKIWKIWGSGIKLSIHVRVSLYFSQHKNPSLWEVMRQP